MKIKFCGATTSVTGSCHLISTDRYKLLLDCGQYQGGKTLEKMNRDPFPFDPSKVDAMILSHAHVDHCGRIPLLIKQGFRGPIYCTKATSELVKVMLRDCGYIHEREAEWENKKALRQGRPLIEPLYTVEEAEAVFPYIHPVLYDQLVKINDDMKIVFNDAGHILGSAITEIWVKDSDTDESEKNYNKIVFSGDLGMPNRPILRDPTIIKKADYVIMETTYGDRLHEKNADSVQKLIDIIISTYKKGGNVIIPSFAVGRTQELIYQLDRFYDTNNEYQEILNKIQVYIDSPMATNVTAIFKNNSQVFDKETRDYILNGENPLDFRNLHFTKTTQESMDLNNNDGQTKIIISASGMCDAGRIKHHLKHNLWNPKNSIVFVGYQANGTLGRQIVDGASDVTIMGEVIHVGATIYNLQGFSGHADRDGLLHWLKGFQTIPKNIFLVHGEADSKIAFANYVKEQTNLDCTVIHNICEYELEQNSQITEQDMLKDIIDEEKLANIRDKIGMIHDNLEKILYNTSLAMGEDLTPKQLVTINNVVQELEKDALHLGTLTTKESIERKDD